LQLPEILPVYVACLCPDADNFHHPKAKLFVWQAFLPQKTLARWQAAFNFSQETRCIFLVGIAVSFGQHCMVSWLKVLKINMVPKTYTVV
jgi:hypothetical protein